MVSFSSSLHSSTLLYTSLYTPLQMLKGRAAAYRSNHLLVPFGDDFKFKYAGTQFSNMDQLVTHINKNHKDVHIRYSTLSEYFSAVHSSNSGGGNGAGEREFVIYFYTN